MVLVSACGGGGSSVGSGPRIGGKVVDGYIAGAKVCLDLNGNASCDEGEPSGETNARGEYEIRLDINSFVGDPNSFHVVAEVPAGAMDSELGAIAEPFNLLAPADSTSTVITPLTTFVSNEMLSTGSTASEAEAVVKTNLGLTTDRLLGYDFIASRDNTTTQVAQVAAATLAAVTKVLRDNPTVASNLTPAEIKRAAIRDVAGNVMPQLMNRNGTVSAELTGKRSSRDLVAAVASNANVLAVTGRVVQIIAGSKSGDGEPIDLQKLRYSEGFVTVEWEDSEHVEGISPSDPPIERSGLQANLALGANEYSYLLRDDTGNWSEVIDDISHIDLIYDPVSDSWVNETRPDPDPVVDGNCAFFPEFANAEVGRRYCLVRKDLSGQRFGLLFPDACERDTRDPRLCNPNALLPEGSVVYDATLTATRDRYKLWPSGWNGYFADDASSAGGPTIEGFIRATSSENNPQFYGPDCTIPFYFSGFNANSGTGTMHWGQNTGDCDSPAISFPASGAHPFTLVTLGDKRVLRVKRAGLEPNESFDEARVAIFARHGSGIYAGNMREQFSRISLPFTGNPWQSLQIVSPILFRFVLREIGVPPYPALE